jgi:type IV secretion system protein TrbL
MWRRFSFPVVICAASQVMLQAQTFTSTVPSGIMDQFRAQRAAWTTNIFVYATALFGILAVIEFAWSAAVMLLEKTDLQSWTSALVRKMMWIGAFYALLLNGNTWIPAIIDSFTTIGQTASGTTALSPGDVFVQGLSIAGALMDGASTSAFFTNPGPSLALVFGAVLIVIAYTIITLNFIVTMVESYILVSAGFIFLGFGGSRWTAPYVERYIGLAVSIGIKILLLYCLIAAGMNLGNGWIAEAQNISSSTRPIMTVFDVMGAAVIFMMLCWQIPKLFSAVLGGSPTLTGGDFAATLGLVAGTAFAAGSAMARGASAVVGAVAAGGAGAGAGAGAGSSGSSASSAVASVGAAGGTGGGTGVAGGGGSVAPPSAPSQGSGGGMGGPRVQPDPPVSSGTTAFAANPDSAPAASTRTGSDATVSSMISSTGGEPLAGSGFEGERPARGFTSAPRPARTSRETRPAPAFASDRAGTTGGEVSPDPGTVSAVPEVSSVATGASAEQTPPRASGWERIVSTARRVHRGLSRASDHMDDMRRRVGPLPSDAAAHATPPRMPIDHHED